MENTGTRLPAEIAGEISQLRGLITTDAWWRGELAGPSGVYISDDASDGIEEMANSEDPETP